MAILIGVHHTQFLERDFSSLSNPPGGFTGLAMASRNVHDPKNQESFGSIGDPLFASLFSFGLVTLLFG